MSWRSWHWPHVLLAAGPGTAPGIEDGQVREPGFHRQEMMTARSVTLLTTDREVGRLGTGLVQDGTEIGRVAEQTAPDAVPLEQRRAQVLVRVLRPLGQPGG